MLAVGHEKVSSSFCGYSFSTGVVHVFMYIKYMS